MSPAWPVVELLRFEVGGATMTWARAPIPLALRPWLLGWSGYEERAPHPIERVELPGAFVPVILAFGGPFAVQESGGAVRRFDGAFVAGLDEGPTPTRHEGWQAGMELKLSPLGAWRFFGQPLKDWQGRSLAWVEVAPRGLGDLPERLAALPDWTERFGLLARGLRALFFKTTASPTVTLRPSADPRGLALATRSHP